MAYVDITETLHWGCRGASYDPAAPQWQSQFCSICNRWYEVWLENGFLHVRLANPPGKPEAA